MALRQGRTERRWSRRFFSSWTTWLLSVAIAAFAIFFSWFSDIKASNYDAHYHDISHMWQSVWNVAHGHGFVFTLTGDEMNVPRLSVHADYALILFAPLSWIWPHYSILLVVQAVGVAFGAWFLERITRRWTGNSTVSTAVAIAYLLYGPLQFAVLWHFHAIMLAPLAIFAAIEAIIYHRRSAVLWLWVGLALITKEQVGLILGPLLWVVARWQNKRRLGWWLGGVAVGYALLHFFVVIPAMRDSGNSHFVWEFYFGSLGTTLPEQLAGLLDPREIIHRLWQPIHLQNLALLLFPLAGLPLLTPLSLLGGLAIVPHWLSDHQSQHTLHATNQMLAVVVLFLSTARVVGQRIRQRRWSPRWLALTLLAASVIGSVVMSPGPWSQYADPAIRRPDPQVRILRSTHRLIPADASVGYSRGAGAEFRDRRYSWLLPNGITRLDYAVVFTSEKTSDWPAFVDQDRRLNDFFRSTQAFRTVYTQGRLSIYQRDRAVPLPAIPDLSFH